MFDRSVKAMRSLLAEHGKMSPEDFLTLTEGIQNPGAALTHLQAIGEVHLEVDKKNQNTVKTISWTGSSSSS